MSGASSFAVDALLIGIGATAFMDALVIVRTRLLGIPALDYALVGRWIGHMPEGQLSHQSIATAPAIAGERAIGWTAHYLIGILFAAALLLIWGAEWASRPSLGPALVVAVVALAAPFLLMQPAMGLGVAASRTPNPGKARLNSFAAHLAFGFGLYLSAWALTFLR
jgi:hypothetical protein